MGDPDAQGLTDRRARNTMSTAILKALANPTRRRILRELGRSEAGRASDIAAALSMPANQVSFHLRVLADAGIIAEAPELARDRRDRVWRSVDAVRELGSPELPMPDEELGQAVLLGIGADIRDLIDRVMRWAPEYATGRAPDVHGGMMQSDIRLTEADFVSMVDELTQVIERYRHREVAPDAEVRSWELMIVAADDQI